MAKRYDKQEHEMRRESSKFQRGETSKQREELANTLLSPADQISIAKQFSAVTHNVLKEEFGDFCDIITKEIGGYYKICMNKKGVKQQSVSQIEITVTRKGKYNIHLNDYDHSDEYYFHGDKLSTKDLVNEMENFKGFLLGKGMPATSKLTKEEYGIPEDYLEKVPA